MESGLLKNKEHEYLIAGKLQFDPKGERFVIRKPDLLIATDRLDFYDFLGRRREHLGKQNRNWLKLCVGLTLAHFLVVRVPTLFSLYFGDEVGQVSQSLGATDERETAIKMKRIKENQQ